MPMQPDMLPRASPKRRLALLGVCLLGGAVVGSIGWLLSGAQAWWLAVPAAVAAGWWFVADPTQCERPVGRNDSRQR
jgi:hypothetical protein